MYVSIRRYEGVTNAKDAAQKVSDGFVPLISQHQGFIAYYVLDSGGGVMTSISLYENKTDAEESTRKAADWVRQTVASFFPNPPQITAGEVVSYKK
ncbi:conserved hypothetical protein [Syntrophobacter sp. SbD1]|nr:conserved hypothetical protein [Syntrophobacter sp. SbD1]